MHFPRLATLLALASGALSWEISIYNQQNCNSGSNFDYARLYTLQHCIILLLCYKLFHITPVLTTCHSTYFLPPSKLVHLLRLNRAVRDSGGTDTLKHSMRILHQRRLQWPPHAMQDPSRRLRHLFQFQI